MEAGDKGHNAESRKETFAFFQPSDRFFHFLFTDLEISKEAKFSFNLLHKCNFSVHLGDRSKTEQEIETNNWHPT